MCNIWILTQNLATEGTQEIKQNLVKSNKYFYEHIILGLAKRPKVERPYNWNINFSLIGSR